MVLVLVERLEVYNHLIEHMVLVELELEQVQV